MKKYYYIFCFTIISVFAQLLVFVSNLNINTDPTPDEIPLNLLNTTLKKMNEQKDFYPINTFKKININDKESIERLNKDLKKNIQLF